MLICFQRQTTFPSGELLCPPRRGGTGTHGEETVFAVDTRLFTEFTASNLRLGKARSGETHRQLPGQAAKNSLPDLSNLLPPGRWQRSLLLGPTPRRPLTGIWSLCKLPAWSYQNKEDGTSGCLVLSIHPKQAGPGGNLGQPPDILHPRTLGDMPFPFHRSSLGCPCLLGVP